MKYTTGSSFSNKRPTLTFLPIFHRFSKEGDFIFSVAKDHNACAWYSANGERFGVYKGHQGALWTVDVDHRTILLATGGADNTMRLWEVKTGRLLKTWEFGTAIKRVEFSEDGKQLLGVTEKRQGQLSTIIVYDINQDVDGEQTSEPSLRIVVEDIPKVTVAGFSYLSKYIISGHEDGSISQWDAKVRNNSCLMNYFIHQPPPFAHEQHFTPTSDANRSHFLDQSTSSSALTLSFTLSNTGSNTNTILPRLASFSTTSSFTMQTCS